MENQVLNFVAEHKDWIIMGAGVVIGLILPLPKIHLLGKTVGAKMPVKARKQLADMLDAFEQGLLQEEFEGDKNLISNKQLSEKTDKLRVDLGLDQ